MSRQCRVKTLPIEDTIWLIDSRSSEDDNGTTQPCLVVSDSTRRIIGSEAVTEGEEVSASLTHNLIQTCCLSPLVGKPRRPKSASFKDKSLAELAAGLDLSDLGIAYLYVGLRQEDSGDAIRMRECCVCRTRGSQELFDTCPGCQAMLYCCPACREADWSRGGTMQGHSHEVWCKTMKKYMAKTDLLRQLPFSFSPETTSEDFDQTAYRKFLEAQGVYNLGYWTREATAQIPGQQHAYGDLWEVDDGFVLPVESVILDEPPDQAPSPGTLDCWADYYGYRGLRLDSPVAILLQWPMTLYHVIANWLPNDYPDSRDHVSGSTLCVDILGVETEVELLPLYMEAGYLLKDYSLDIHMYGGEICRAVDGKVWASGNVTVHIHRALYHKAGDKARKPHLVLGYNAGLGAYASWTKTLKKLKEERTPAYFTDYCQYSCHWARVAIEGLGVGTSPDPVINPFRSPVRKTADENNMPWYSNGFIYHINYPP